MLFSARGIKLMTDGSYKVLVASSISPNSYIYISTVDYAADTG
jgi:hypothetical protein